MNNGVYRRNSVCCFYCEAVHAFVHFCSHVWMKSSNGNMHPCLSMFSHPSPVAKVVHNSLECCCSTSSHSGECCRHYRVINWLSVPTDELPNSGLSFLSWSEESGWKWMDVRLFCCLGWCAVLFCGCCTTDRYCLPWHVAANTKSFFKLLLMFAEL